MDSIQLPDMTAHSPTCKISNWKLPDTQDNHIIIIIFGEPFYKEDLQAHRTMNHPIASQFITIYLGSMEQRLNQIIATQDSILYQDN